ncbi:MAG: translocation/assembly module TamB domain-containing protein [Bacteroidetes bacterium]|nr:translocation/assembly module TamB domain-containing protein [Bacteroidota bacterium]MBL6943787.1 translocation/assembly module TamB domain-containing protein [Bacteroidales bacterium]
MKNKSVRKNIKKKLASFVLYVLLVPAIIPFALTLLFQNHIVQTISARLAANMLSTSLGQSVNINAIRVGIFSGINIDGLWIKDHHNNTLLRVGKLSTMPVFSNFNLKSIKFLTIKLDSVQFNIGSYHDELTDNLSLLIEKISGDGDKSGGNFKIFSGSVKIKNSSFNLFNQNRSYDQDNSTMDYANIVIDSINADLSGFKIINDSLNFRINNLVAREKSGVVVKKLRADFIVSSSGLYTTNALIELNDSYIDGDFGMEYSNYTSFSYYLDSVNMTANIRPSTINMANIGYFADVLFKMPNVVGITGKMNGTVRDLTGEDLKIKYGKNTRVSGDIRFTGLPDFYSTYMVVKELIITTNPQDIGNFYLPIVEKHLDFPNIIPPKEQIMVKGNFNGYYEDFSSSLDILLSYGKIKSEIKFKNTTENMLSFNVKVNGDSVNIGKLVNQTNLLGKMNFDLNISGEGKYPENISYNTSGILTNVDLLGYNYSRMSIVGSYANDSVLADLRVGDKNLMMTASAKAHIATNPVFTVSSNIVSANLNKINLWYDQNINLSSQLHAKVTGTNINTLNAHIALTKNKLVYDDNEYIIDSIILTKQTDSFNVTKTHLSSDVIIADVTGKYNISTLTQSIFRLADYYFNIIPGDESTYVVVDDYVDIDVNLLKPKIFTDQFLSGISISPNTKLHTVLNFSNNNFQADFSSNKIQYRDVSLDSSTLTIHRLNNYVFSELAISNIILKDSTAEDTLVFGIDDFSLSARIGNDSITYGIYWDNQNPALKNSGILEGYIADVADSIKINIGKADVYLNNVIWNIEPNNLVVMYNDRIFFHNIYIHTGESGFKLIGTVPKYENDSLVAEFADWNLSNFDILTKPMNFDLNGEINGFLNLTLIKNNPTLVSDITIKELELNDEYLGEARIMNTWDNTNNSVFIKSQIIRQGEAGRGEVFSADGYYYPTKKDDNLNIDVSFNRFKLRTLEPFFSDVVNNLEGTTSGNLSIRGSVLQPVITGSADMQRTAMRIVYLNTKYSFSNSIEFVKNGIRFDKLVIYDTLGNQAYINGSLTHNYFTNPMFDMVITTPGLLFFNTTSRMNELYYGTAIASGNIKITGRPDDVDLRLDIKTQKGTSVVLPLNYSVEISDKDYIIFTKPAFDSIQENVLLELVEINEKTELNYNINVKMEVTPVAHVSISLPADMGTIDARGNSNLALDVDSKGKFSLVGDYIVEEGLFHFKIGNLVSKRFTLVRGGRISWSGNPYSANVNIKGLYKVKTSLSSLGIIIDSTVSFKNKVTVECYVVLTNELLNPNIRFEIKIPDLDPDYQRAVFSNLDTTNAAMMNQQMISLLVLGTFNFNNAASISIESSYYNVIANQLSSLLSQISENVDIGLNYKPGDEVSQQEFEVALSTQLFDDRLTIESNFGMSYDRSQQSASNIVGDVDIGYKLAPDGRWVLKVFNHSNVNSWYNYSNYDQTSPYTQGVGIAFRKDFNNIAELFGSRKKNSRDKREIKSNQESIKPEDEDSQ